MQLPGLHGQFLPPAVCLPGPWLGRASPSGKRAPLPSTLPRQPPHPLCFGTCREAAHGELPGVVCVHGKAATWGTEAAWVRTHARTLNRWPKLCVCFHVCKTSLRNVVSTSINPYGHIITSELRLGSPPHTGHLKLQYLVELKNVPQRLPSRRNNLPFVQFERICWARHNTLWVSTLKFLDAVAWG